MKKWFSLSSQFALLVGAASLSTVATASCSVEVWRTNIQMVVAPGGSKLADHSFQQNSFDGILRFLKEVRYRGEKFIGPKPEKSIEKLGGIWRKPIDFDAMRFMESYRDAHASGADVIVCTGFEQAGPLGEFSSRSQHVLNQFPGWVQKVRNELGIVYVDGSLDGKKSNPYNIATVSYASDQAGIMAGVLTGIVLNIDHYYQPQDVDFSSENYKGIQTAVYQDGKIVTEGTNVKTKTLTPLKGTSGWYKGKAFKIGGYVGLPGRPTLAFLNGWFQGARFFNEHLYEVRKITEKQISDLDQTKTWYPLTVVGAASDRCVDLVMDGFSAGGFSPVSAKAKQLTNNYVDRKIAAFLPVAGSQDALVVNEIMQKQKHLAVIGTNVALEDDDSVNQYITREIHKKIFRRSIIPFSIMKNLTNTVYSILTALNNSMVDGKIAEDVHGYHGFGYNNFGILANDGVKVSHGKIYYDNNSHQQSVDETSSETLCPKLVKALKEAMDQREKWKVEVAIGGQMQKVPFYESLNGHEFETTWVTNYDHTSFISVPRIRDPSNHINGNNVYEPLPFQAQLIAEQNDLATFVQNLYKRIGKPPEKTSSQVNWYMYQ